MAQFSSHTASQMFNEDAQDLIRVNNLALNVLLEDGAKWPGAKLQPILATIALVHDVAEAAATDDLNHSLNYSTLCKAAVEAASSQSYPSLESLWDDIVQAARTCFSSVTELSVKVVKTRAPIHCKIVSYEGSWSQSDANRPCRYDIEDLECHTIVGVNDCERIEKQVVRFNISIICNNRRACFDFRHASRCIYDDVAKTSFQTLEALASFVAIVTLRCTPHASDMVTVRAAKPDALVYAASSEIEITRTRKHYPKEFVSTSSPSLIVPMTATESLPSLRDFIPPSTPADRSQYSTASIALGSNLGDSFANIETALRMLENPSDFLPASECSADAEVAVLNTSFMYQTAPMYVTDQPKFINCACIIETNVSPPVLLKLLKTIETTVGRVPSIRNGPRAVDLDIITYDSQVLDTRRPEQRTELGDLTGELLIPHPRMDEREFVLRPLNDMIPDYIHPVSHKTISALLDELLVSQPADTPPMRKVIPFPKYPFTSASNPKIIPPTATHWSLPSIPSRPSPTSQKTYIMGTLNATPDSFSDGSAHNTVAAALGYAATAVAAGADIIDIGGYSTRPHAAYVSPEEEISRVVPIIAALRQDTRTAGTLISVDTFRAEVARAAVLAGANCINDVYAFTGPASFPLTQASAEHLMAMRRVARELGVPVVLMHSRGDAGANKDYAAYAGGVVEAVKVELGEKVDAVVTGRGGVRRWLVIADPGVGFSKTVEGNLDTLRGVPSFISPSSSPRNPLAGFPQLIGVSRKSFLGAILKEPDEDGAYEGRETQPKERGWATAAAVAHAVQQGTAVIRVHDVAELGDTVRIASALRG